jgi:hypothetical protein
MTPTEAIRHLEALGHHARNDATKEAVRLAVEALRNDPTTLAKSILDASGKTDATVAILRSGEGDHWFAWVHKGPAVHSKTLTEALAGLLEKVKK